MEQGLRRASPQLEIWPCPDTAQTAWRWTWDERLFNSCLSPAFRAQGFHLGFRSVRIRPKLTAVTPLPLPSYLCSAGHHVMPSDVLCVDACDTLLVCLPTLFISTNLENTGQTIGPDL